MSIDRTQIDAVLGALIDPNTGRTFADAKSFRNITVDGAKAGVNVVRLNFSHGRAQDHVERANLVRQAAASCRREIAIMADLQGPKIREPYRRWVPVTSRKMPPSATCTVGVKRIIQRASASSALASRAASCSA